MQYKVFQELLFFQLPSDMRMRQNKVRAIQFFGLRRYSKSALKSLSFENEKSPEKAVLIKIALKRKSDAIFVTQAKAAAIDFQELLMRESVILSAKARFTDSFVNWNVVTLQATPGTSR